MLRQEDCLSLGLQDHSRKHSETPSQNNNSKKIKMVNFMLILLPLKIKINGGERGK
jgi:hypothetical protein